MTINSPASILWAMYLVVAEQPGRGLEAAFRHAAERHPQGIHRAEGVPLSAGAVDAPGRRHAGVRRAPSRRASIPSRFPATTSAKRARRRCRNWHSPSMTASSTSSGRCGVAWPSTISRPRLSFFFNAHNDFFEEIAKYPRRAQDLVPGHDGALQREESSLDVDALPHADGGGSLTAQQPKNNIARVAIAGARGGAGGNAVAAHGRIRRGPCPAHGGCGADRASHAADSRL